MGSRGISCCRYNVSTRAIQLTTDSGALILAIDARTLGIRATASDGLQRDEGDDVYGRDLYDMRLVQDAYHLRQCIADNKPEHRTGLTAPTNTMRFHDQKQQENWRVNLSIVAMMMSVRSSLGLHLAFDIPAWALSGNA